MRKDTDGSPYSSDLIQMKDIFENKGNYGCRDKNKKTDITHSYHSLVFLVLALIIGSYCLGYAAEHYSDKRILNR